jgi:hypothetical protein
LDRMRVLQGNGLGAVQDNPAENPRIERVDVGRAGCKVEMRPVRQTARAILSRAARRPTGLCSKLLKQELFRPKNKSGPGLRNQTINEIINARYGLQRAGLRRTCNLDFNSAAKAASNIAHDFSPLWTIKSSDYRRSAIGVQFTNCTASLMPPIPALAAFGRQRLVIC